jgi:NTE family protein
LAEIRAFLAEVPILAGCTPGMREELVEGVRLLAVEAGTYLFHQGDPPDDLYIVYTGRLAIVLDGDPPRVARIVGRGAAIGELGVFTGAPRSASVRAVRDTEVLVLPGKNVIRAMESVPGFAFAVARVLSGALQRSGGLQPGPPEAPATIAVASLEPGLASSDLAVALAEAMDAVAPTARMDPPEHPGHTGAARLLDRLEADHTHVVMDAGFLHGDERDESWPRFCLRQADRIVLATAGGPIPEWVCTRPDRLVGRDLAIVGAPRAPALEPWLTALRPRARHPVRAYHRSSTIDRMARRLAGRSVGLALSGGGARAFVHLGVLLALHEAGIPVDRVGGTSMGAFIGAQVAMGRHPEQMVETCRRVWVDRRQLDDYTVPRVSLIRARKIRATLERLYGGRSIEELDRDFFAISADLLGAGTVVHRQGPVFAAVGASMSLPVLAPPVVSDGRLLIDGGVLNNLPVDVMVETGEGPVIGVDARGRRPAPLPTTRRARTGSRLTAGVRTWVHGSDVPLPHMLELIGAAMTLCSWRTSEEHAEQADLLIAPRMDEIDMFQFDALDDLVERGRRATLEALEQSPGALGSALP